MIMVSLEAVANASRSDGCAATKILDTILTHSMPDIGKVATLRDLVVQGQFKDSSFPLCSWVLFRLLLVGV